MNYVNYFTLESQFSSFKRRDMIDFLERALLENHACSKRFLKKAFVHWSGGDLSRREEWIEFERLQVGEEVYHNCVILRFGYLEV